MTARRHGARLGIVGRAGDLARHQGRRALAVPGLLPGEVAATASTARRRASRAAATAGSSVPSSAPRR